MFKTIKTVQMKKATSFESFQRMSERQKRKWIIDKAGGAAKLGEGGVIMDDHSDLIVTFNAAKGGFIYNIQVVKLSEELERYGAEALAEMAVSKGKLN
jgi:hypothetical protein